VNFFDSEDLDISPRDVIQQSGQTGPAQQQPGQQRKKKINRRQRQQRLNPSGVAQKQQQQSNQQQQGGQNKQVSPRNAESGGVQRVINVNQGVQGPFGRFRGESLSSWTDTMPTTIQELFKNIPLEAMMIENWVRKRLVLVGDQQPLDKALQRLNRHKITSLPIINEQTGNIKGILDSLDIVNYLSTVLDQEAIGPARWDFNLKTTGELLELSKSKAFVMSNQSNVYDALKVLSKGTPRLMVIDSNTEGHQQEKEEEGILGLFTQSDIIRFLASNPYWLNLFPNSHKKLSELNLFNNSHEKVVSVEQNTSAYLAFKKIAESNTSGIAVIDNDGRIVANLSASNIRGISRRNFQLLRRPLFEFLQRDRRRGWWTMPVTLKESDTLEKAILQFGSTKVHQMHVCDIDGKPKYVVNLTDMVRVFLGEEDRDVHA
jgi:CBS domain-containing protein